MLRLLAAERAECNSANQFSVIRILAAHVYGSWTPFGLPFFFERTYAFEVVKMLAMLSTRLGKLHHARSHPLALL
jgi:hypothetical protein